MSLYKTKVKIMGVVKKSDKPLTLYTWQHIGIKNCNKFTFPMLDDVFINQLKDILKTNKYITITYDDDYLIYKINKLCII